MKEEPVKEEPVQKEEVGVPGKEVSWWQRVFGEPKYGGTITLRGGDVTTIDPWYMDCQLWGWESLFHYDNTLSEEEMLLYKIQPAIECPTVMGTKTLPWLAESFEQTDPLTYIVHIRKGVRWHNKPPVNGREFTAYDVEYHLHRLLGLGKYGFTTPSPWCALSQYANIVSIDATDKYTLVYKFKIDALSNLDAILVGNIINQKFVCPKEAVDLWGNINDWKRIIGTGPYIINDYVTSSAITYVRNSEYWGYDERYPENKLPYADIVKSAIVPDKSTAIAALRTGKIELMGGMIGALTWEEAASLKKTNPELVQQFDLSGGTGIEFRNDTAPFNDVRVRKACQMAMDLKTIAETYYGGIPDGTPVGILTPYFKNYVVPYAEWPQELKDEYAHNPEGAKKLLAEAGYPSGFKTNCLASTGSALDLLQVLKAYLFDIGIDMEIKTMDTAAYTAARRTGKWDQMVFSGTTANIMSWEKMFLRDYTPNAMWETYANDFDFNKVYDKMLVATTREEQQRLCREMYLWDLQKHWRIYLQPSPSFTVYQPWLKGYFGEYLHVNYISLYLSRWWIDTDLKKALGR